MKKLSSLLLTLAVGLSGLVLIAPARAQQVAAAGGSVGKLKEEYERLLAVERSPETPPDARELNRAFLKQRREQLAAALRGRINTLRGYHDSLATTLSDAEKRVVVNSIQRLTEELATITGPDPLARREGSSPTPSPPQSSADAIRVVSPSDGAKTSVATIEVEVAIGRDEIDDVMLAAYEVGKEKPFGARKVEIKRSDRGVKRIPVTLRRGENRIEVTSSQVEGAKAEVTITYVPVAAVGDTAVGVVTPPDSSKFVLCGQLTPESLNQTIGLIRSSDELEAVAEEFVKPGSALRSSRLTDDCGTNSARSNGEQKEAIVKQLRVVAALMQGQGGRGGITLPDEFRSLSSATVRRQVLLLNQYFGNVAVRVTKEDGSVVAIGYTDRDGNYFFDNITQADCEPYCSVSTEADNYQTKRKFTAATGASQRVNLVVDDQPVSLLARAVVGYEQTGASSAKREQTYFFDLFLRKSMPFLQEINPDFGERFSTWGNIRFTSVPQPGNTALGTFISNFSQQAANVEVKDVARIFDFMAGIEIRLTGNNRLLPSFDRQTKQKFSLSFIAGGGSITPLDSRETLATFRVFPGAPGLPPEARDKEFVSFIAADRDRFFRQYFAGLRVQTFFFNKYNVPMQRFPAQLDLTVGQNEFVTGGKLRGVVIRVEGYYPLPYDDLNFINLFATAQLRPGSASNNLPLVLQPAPADVTVPSANTVLVLAPQSNRDYYRAGVGIDFISFLGALRRAASQ